MKILHDFLLSFNLDRVPFDATHHRDRNNSHTAIDYIYVSDLSMVMSFKQEHQPAISEHDLVFASLVFPVSHRVLAAITRRSYKSSCLDHFQNDLSKLDWQTLAALPNIDSKVEYFSEGLISVCDVHAPVYSFVPKKDYFPWVTSNIKNLIAERNKAWKFYKRRRGLDAPSRYNLLRNRTQIEIRNAKHNFFKSKLLNASNSRDMWRTINDIGLSKNNHDFLLPFDADSLNAHFVNTASNTFNFSGRPTTRIAPDERFYFKHVEASDVIEVVKSARSNAIGCDGIQLRQITDSLPVILCFLMHIFDFSLQSGVFPTLWKRALVRPLPKSRSAKTLSDFRPISILCALSKIFESLAAKQILSFIRDKGSLDGLQSGFRKGFSTHTLLSLKWWMTSGRQLTQKLSLSCHH